MQVIRGTDVNDLYYRGMRVLRELGVREESRNGPVMVLPWPVTSVYEKPTQRVLFDPERAANPFFHLFESLWMLAGRDDVAALNNYITDFGTRFAEADGKVHGAYGHRWRKALGYDQLDAIVARLKSNPQDRQAVLQMWDGRTHYAGCNDLLGDWKDRPCNTQVMFRVRQEEPPEQYAAAGAEPYRVLDMTITCRSNDIVYGAYGANAVHFSVLQEYMAGRIGVSVGTMYQISNNYHAYVDVLDRLASKGQQQLFTYESMGLLHAQPMGNDWDEWDKDLDMFMKWRDQLTEHQIQSPGVILHEYANNWFTETAEPMFRAHYLFKHAMKKQALDLAESIGAMDWRMACVKWLSVRTDPRSR